MENIEAIEKRLWSSADNLRANSNYASNEYFLPVMGLIFLRHAYSRYLAVKDKLEANLPKRGGKPRSLAKEDFSGKGAIYLSPESQFDYLVELRDADDRAAAIIHAMETIEKSYETLKGVLPKAEYRELDNDVIGQLLRTFNDPALKSASGDVFGRIYEYFLTGFADQKAHDNGEFFTPVSLVQMIVNVIEPDHGTVLDPACGSGGMFVQSAHFVERLHHNPTEELTFFGMEKNATTIRLAKMNLAVHGLEGNIQKAITYYDWETHELVGKADFVMANPPFNVDEVDAEKIKNDLRLPFGLPGVNKAKKVSNGNYLWISYFHSYLGAKGRAGFVMSSQASSAGHGEAEVRRKLIETGDVDVMIAIRSNFFYTRTVPCELWHFDRGKPVGRRDQVLMLDARNVYRKVTRKIYDFSPEQLANLSAIVWLYRGEAGRFVDIVQRYLGRTLIEAVKLTELVMTFHKAYDAMADATIPFLRAVHKNPTLNDLAKEREDAAKACFQELEVWIARIAKDWKKPCEQKLAAQKKRTTELDALATACRDLVKDVDLVCKLAARLVDTAEKDAGAREQEAWDGRLINRLEKELDAHRKELVEQLKQTAYFQRQAHWLLSRFPDAKLVPVPGLCKVVTRAVIKAADWVLPRYHGRLS
ncbi:MAG: N-6 DNA methylase [Nitrospirae bacterium]|nr:N-6 DNA methylase [Nitrospirota bacterium]